jgi:MurNAc alpha-1-phosphate uridylyltransferase
MVLAAGRGMRMRPLTECTAKPLLPLAGRTLLDHALDRLREAGVDTVVVNAHWHANGVAARLAARADAGERPCTILQREEVLLDTGGSVAAALPVLGEGPFFIINGDAFWLDGPRFALERLAESLDPAEQDAVLLLQRTFQVRADVGLGDFALDNWGGLRRRGEREVVPYIYAGVQIATPALLAGAPAGAFSMNRAWDRAIAAGRLRGMVHDGLWFHLSTPADLAEAESMLGMRRAGERR